MLKAMSTLNHFLTHGTAEEEEDHGPDQPPLHNVGVDHEAEAKRRKLVAEIVAYKSM